MKHYTVIWEKRWQSGSHHHCMTKRTWVRCDDIKKLMESDYGQCAVFIFEGCQLTLGETFRLEDVIKIN